MVFGALYGDVRRGLDGIAAAAEPLLPAADLRARERAQLVSVVDDNTVVLTTGSQVRLVGLLAPKLPLRWVGLTAWPLAEETLTARTISLGAARSPFTWAVAGETAIAGIWPTWCVTTVCGCKAHDHAVWAAAIFRPSLTGCSMAAAGAGALPAVGALST